MTLFQKRIAIRIGVVSVGLALLLSPFAWFFAQNSMHKSFIELAIEDTHHLVEKGGAIDLESADVQSQALTAMKNIVTGIFDVAEIYDKDGKKIAEAFNPEGGAIHDQLQGHLTPYFFEPTYQYLKLSDGRSVFNVFVPLYEKSKDRKSPVVAYFEGLRIIPPWQENQVWLVSLVSVLLISLASLLCGALMYPVLIHLNKQNEKHTQEVLNSHIAMMNSLGSAIAKRDSETGAHNHRVAWISIRLAEKTHFKTSSMQSLIAGSFLHDIGKIAISDTILLKPGKLTEAETIIMHGHVSHGEDLISGMGWLEGAHEIIAEHHEKWDGSGYPRGLARKQISLSARIFAVADVFDALCCARPYKEAIDFESVMRIMNSESGTHFDPEVMTAFNSIAAEVYTELKQVNENDLENNLNIKIRKYFYV